MRESSHCLAYASPVLTLSTKLGFVILTVECNIYTSDKKNQFLHVSVVYLLFG